MIKHRLTKACICI